MLSFSNKLYVCYFVKYLHCCKTLTIVEYINECILHVLLLLSLLVLNDVSVRLYENYRS